MYRTIETGVEADAGMHRAAHDGRRDVSLEMQGAGMLLSGFIRGRNRRLRRERLRLQRQLRRSSELVASLAHELRSPLQGVLGVAELLARDEPHAERRRLLLDMRRSAMHVLHLTDDSLERVRLEHEPPRPAAKTFRLETVIGDVLAGVRPLRAEGVELAVDLGGVTAAGQTGDPDCLRQILTNLLSNSLARTRDGHVLLTATTGEGDVAFSVHDSGPGIPERKQRELTRPFAQGSRPGKAGMGLAIASRLVTALGGRLSVYSQPGEGTCFRIRLPFPSTAAALPGPERNLRRVGVAEDAVLHRRNVLACLGRWNCDVYAFDTPTDIARWLDAPTALDALVISQEWLAGTGAEDTLRAHCRRHGIALVVHGDADDPASMPATLQTDRVWQRPMLPGDLAAALDHVSQLREGTHGYAPTVLVVDDNPLVRSLLAAAVGALGCKPVLAEDGAAAVRAAARDLTIDAVLLDRNMPGMDGIEAARQLRGQPATRRATLLLLVNDEDEAVGAAVGAANGIIDRVLVRPRGREALERWLGPLLMPDRALRGPARRGPARRGPARSGPADSGTRGAAITSRELEASLDEDLCELETALSQGDAERVRASIHRMRGALRLFPVRRHEAWLAAMTDAASRWQPRENPTAMRRALENARRELRRGR